MHNIQYQTERRNHQKRGIENMVTEFFEVRQLDYAAIKPGQKWLYATDLNIKHTGDKLKSTDRIDCELHDIKTILDNNGIILILAHKGRFKDGDTEELDFVIPTLSQKLGKEIKYCKENSNQTAIDFVNSLKPGDVAIMSNARKNEGEEKCDSTLSLQYAKLVGVDGAVAVGGFGKSHRKEASNCGVLEYLPGYLTQSQINEMRMIQPWAGKKEGTYSIAILGGVKKEKIKTGLAGFSETYDCIIPGGIVLNTILKVLGFEVGNSLITDGDKSFEKNVAPIMSGPNKSKIIVPTEVVISKTLDFKTFEDTKTIKITEGVPKGYVIVDYVMPKEGFDALDKVVNEKGRIVVAGTPGVYTSGFKLATDAVIERLNKPGVKAIALGGDTAAEVKFNGPASTGGGSALYFVAYGTTEVFDALKKNKEKFNV
ncbi:MAG: phosphoglycerate kinase [Candidatus Woesearchaeota archaeon]